MKKLIINDSNLNETEIDEYINKVRAILINDNNEILVANYGNVLLLPGGSIDNGETVEDAIKRELKEETGISYENDELKRFVTINYYQKNYPKRNGKIKNRLLLTTYFLGKYKGINKEQVILTEKEIKDNFYLELININMLNDRMIQNENNNPRNYYFKNELKEVLKYYDSEINEIHYIKTHKI